MKIFLSFLQSASKYPIPAYAFWSHYLKNGITEARDEWEECPDVDWALGLVLQTEPELSTWREKVWSRTVTWLKKHPSDIFLSYLYPQQIDPSAIKEIQKLGIVCVNFFCDHVRLFTKLPKEFKVFNLNWVPEFNALPLYQNAGAAFINLPMPMWVHPIDRVLKQETAQQITFIGSKDLQRKMLFEEIVKLSTNLPLAIYGNGWLRDTGANATAASTYTLPKQLRYQLTFSRQHGLSAYIRKLKQRGISPAPSPALNEKLGGQPDFAAYNRLTSQSMITVGVSRYPSFSFPLLHPNTYSRLRDIEAPMLGACYLAEWAPGLEQLYDLGQEIETYTNAETFVEKAGCLLADEQKRTMLKQNGQKRALQDHSIPQSLSKLFARLKS